jgi:hypothetical protein
VREPGKFEQGRGVAKRAGSALPKVAREHHQVFDDGEIRIERIMLWHDPNASPHVQCLFGHRKAKHPNLPDIGQGQAKQQPERRTLSRTIGPEQTETLARTHLQIQIA